MSAMRKNAIDTTIGKTRSSARYLSAAHIKAD